MPIDPSPRFQSVLSALMDKFLQVKHACGYAYHEGTRILRHLDNVLVQEGSAACELPGCLARKWLAKKAYESARSQQQRITVFRQFSRFLLRLGYSAYVPDSTLAGRRPSTFVPRMLSDEELRKFFQAVDALEPTARSPLRHLIMPEVFRLLYGCGFRVREVLKLRVRDVDLNQGIITVRQVLQVKQGIVPAPLQRARDQTLRGIDLQIASLGEGRFVLGAFDPHLPLTPEGLIAPLQLRQSRQGELEFGGLQGLQHLLRDGGIE